MLRLSAVVDFLDQNYRYKSVTTKIPHDTLDQELSPCPYAVADAHGAMGCD
jgi:hypothetical protein